jgi:hypothetical protein
MDDAKAVRRAALDTECARQEARQRKNVCQEGALGALPQGYGTGAPHVAGANKERLRRNQGACHLLAQNPRLQNGPFRSIVLAAVPPRPQAQAGAVYAGTVVTPIPVGALEEGAVHPPPAAVFQLGEQQAAPLQLPMLGEFTAMVVPPLAPNAGAWLPAAPWTGGGSKQCGAQSHCCGTVLCCQCCNGRGGGTHHC